MRIYTAFMVDGCIKTPISTPQRIIANAIWEIEGKKAGAQERRDEFQERGVYFEVGYADVDLVPILCKSYSADNSNCIIQHLIPLYRSIPVDL